MTSKKIRAIGAAALALVWAALTLSAWFKPADAASSSERRDLAQMPAITLDSLLDNSDMGFAQRFEKYTTDQFPLRDDFRYVKSLFHNHVLQQLTNNDLYVSNGYAAEMLYPLEEGKVQQCLEVLKAAYKGFVENKNCNVYLTVVPDKNYYLAPSSGRLTLDYEKMITMMKKELPDAKYIDITGTLSIEDYYRTDTHWRQENLVPTAQVICQAMGVTPPQQSEYTPTALEKTFYGVYYGQASMRTPGETMYVMNSAKLSACTVTNYVATNTGVRGNKSANIYNKGMLNTSQDQYDVFLSGVNPLMRIENRKATGNKELIVFRDSFGSSMVPLLVSDYAAVTLIDLRQVQDWNFILKAGVDFTGKDVLFMPSTLVLNKGSLGMPKVPLPTQTPVENQTPTEGQIQE